MGANKVTYGRYKNNMMIMFLALALIFIDNAFSKPINVDGLNFEVGGVPLLKDDKYCIYDLLPDNIKSNIIKRNVAIVNRGQCEETTEYITLNNFIKAKDALNSLHYLESILVCIVGNVECNIKAKVLGGVVRNQKFNIEGATYHINKGKISYTFFIRGEKDGLLKVYCKNIASKDQSIIVNFVLD